METITVFIDEAWRGPIAGPVVVGLIMGWDTTDRSPYKDSKSLSSKQRKLLADQIKSDSSIIRATGSASPKEIDRNGIIRALRWATIRGLYKMIYQMSKGIGFAIEKNNQCYRKVLSQQLSILTHNLSPVTLVIDWNHTFGLDQELWVSVHTIIKWDRDVPQISAASILAKTTRDAEMIKLWATYAWYGFEQHMWYGTAKHYQAITALGLCTIHRITRITNTIYCKNHQNTHTWLD